MKIGLIARCEVARGLAVQSRNFYDNMPVDRVLLVKHPHPRCEIAPEWYRDATPVAWDINNHTIEQNVARQWMEGLDVVFTVETTYDWRFSDWARAAGVRTVIQGNPEFVRHMRPEGADLPHPTEWWWPTSWRREELPPGPVVPVPMPNVANVAADPHEGPLKILHVVGKRAHLDRNGTDIFLQSLRSSTQPMEVTIHAFDGGVGDVPRRKHLTYRVVDKMVTDLWSMYADQHLLVMPRKYGGLCLPALEAAASGLAVMMTDCSPNYELASLFIGPRRWLKMNVAAGEIRYAEVNALDLAAELDRIARNRTLVADGQRQSHTMVPRWDDWRRRYLDAFARLIG